MNLDSLIDKIKKKNELSGLSKDFVKKEVLIYLKRSKLNLPDLTKKETKLIISNVRASLRKYTGRFQKSLKIDPNLKTQSDFSNLLKKHHSTSERLDFYPKIKSLITKLKIKSIVDLGCGINPIALASPKIKYFASDIKESDLSLVETYFKFKKINGKTFTFDLRDINESYSKIPKADMCILFKVLDVIEAGNKNYKLTSSILKKIKCRYFLVSFATKKLSGKRMNYPRRQWFEKLLSHLNLKYESFSSENEVFYLINSDSKAKSLQ